MYEYANGLAAKGWRVRVIHPALLTEDDIEQTRRSPWLRVRRWIGYNRRKRNGAFRPDEWFKVHQDVELLHVPTLEARFLPPSDAWVATQWRTAPWVARYPGARLYLIQHLETWCGAESEVMATWKMPLRKIVIARWLKKIADQMGEEASYIPNGLDFETFGLDVPMADRNPSLVAMCYHASEWKGSADGLRALEIVKSKKPDLKALFFGLGPAPSDLPDWIEYEQKPAQKRLREIYNRAAVFVAPSWTEGWGLPPCEAMQCGAAVAATDIDGHREFAVDRDNALLSPAKNPDALAANILRLIEDKELRAQIARRGNESIKRFTWQRSIDEFEAVLESELDTKGRAPARTGVDIETEFSKEAIG